MGLCELRPSNPNLKMKVCVACRNDIEEEKVVKCCLCDSGCFCSDACMRQVVETDEHQLLCMSIQHLEEVQMNRRLTALPLKEKNPVPVKRKLVGLVGEKPIIHCVIGMVVLM